MTRYFMQGDTAMPIFDKQEDNDWQQLENTNLEVGCTFPAYEEDSTEEEECE